MPLALLSTTKIVAQDFVLDQITVSANRVFTPVNETGAIVDVIDDEGAVCRTKADAPEIDGNLFIEENFEKISVGDILKVHVTAASDYDLWGTISKDQK